MHFIYQIGELKQRKALDITGEERYKALEKAAA
jgi:hypothetical protein